MAVHSIVVKSDLSTYNLGMVTYIHFSFNVLKSADSDASYAISVNWGPVVHERANLNISKSGNTITVKASYQYLHASKYKVIVSVARIQGGWCGRGEKNFTVVAPTTTTAPTTPQDNRDITEKTKDLLRHTPLLGEFIRRLESFRPY